MFFFRVTLLKVIVKSRVNDEIFKDLTRTFVLIYFPSFTVCTV